MITMRKHTQSGIEKSNYNSLNEIQICLMGLGLTISSRSSNLSWIQSWIKFFTDLTSRLKLTTI
jgi:hypothetical protein